VIGGVVGFFVGFYFFIIQGEGDEAFAGGVVLGLPPGVVVGAIVGVLFPRLKRWIQRT
jgi:hypothetical protein